MPIKDPRILIAALPPLPGVYRFQNADGKDLYVGKAINLKKRVSSYFQKTRQSPRIQLMLNAAATVETATAASEAEALLLENNLIKSLKPRYNILFRDDKSYPYLRLSKHAYPRLMYYRGDAKDDDDYYGPFPDSAAVRETIDILQRVFRLRTCADGVLATRERPCLLAGIGRCSAPCINRISPQAYAADAEQARRLLNGGVSPTAAALKQRMEKAAQEQQFEEAAVARDQLRALAVVRSRHFAEDADAPDADYVGVHHDGRHACVNIIMLRGGRRVGEKRLFPHHADNADSGDVLRALLTQHYQKHAPTKIYLPQPPDDWPSLPPPLEGRVVAHPQGEARARVARAGENARHALAMYGAQRATRHERLNLLAKRLNLPQQPRRLECFDISHSMGEETMAARTVFEDGAPYRKDYRLYRIKTAAAGNDTAAMGEAVRRCYRRAVAENAPLPQVLFIDGGAGQVSAAKAALTEAFTDSASPPPPIIGVAKGEARRPGEETLVFEDGETMQLPRTDGALHLIQALRDEAHRFAGEGHRRRRDKKRSGSATLTGIEGVGPKKQRLLVSAFGGLTALRSASMAELVKITGIGPQLAARIYNSLHR